MRSLPYRPPPAITRPQQLHVHDRFKKAKSASLSGKLRLRRSDRFVQILLVLVSLLASCLPFTKHCINYAATTALSQLAHTPTSEIGILACVRHTIFWLLEYVVNY